MKRKSNQRITKIKLDKVLELLKKAEGIQPKDGTTIQAPGEELTPYPDMDQLRSWSRKYFTKGLDKILINRFDDDGQTYMTTLVDGLPLFTKMTKTFDKKQLPYIEYHLADYLTTIGTLDFSTHWVSGFKDNSNYIKVTQPNNNLTVGTQFIFKFQTGSEVTSGQTIFHGQNKIMLEIYDGTFRIWSWTQNKFITGASVIANTTYWVRVTVTSTSNRTFEYSTDNFETVKYIFSTNEVSQGSTSAMNENGLLVGLSSYDLTYAFKGKFDLLNSSRRLGSDGTVVSMMNANESTYGVPVETSKPGLWLSNLVAPTAGKGGSWLRHNLIHQEDPIELLNNDTIGNYSFSFLQRSIISRDESAKGDVFWNSYAQHWSPSAASCTSHDSLVAIYNRDFQGVTCPVFGPGYTPYQSLVVPVDVDMQSYEETGSKCLDYDFREGYTGLLKTHFHNRVVGTDWTYELWFTPNASGSANNYGQSENPDTTLDDGNNGGCITGTITYTNITTDGIIECQQTVNSCFKTGQTLFNPNVPSSDDSILNNQEYKSISVFYADGKFRDVWTHSSLYIPNGQQYLSYKGQSQTSTCAKYAGISPEDLYCKQCGSDGGCTYNVTLEPGLHTVETSIDQDGNYTSDQYTRGFTTGERHVYSITGVTVDTEKKGNGIKSSDYLGCGCGWTKDLRSVGTLTYASPSEVSDQSNVNIYLIITDLRKKYAELGMPWSYDCTMNAFEFKFSTTQCQESYCTNLLIASGVDINNLGDISKLNNLHLTK